MRMNGNLLSFKLPNILYKYILPENLYDENDKVSHNIFYYF